MPQNNFGDCISHGEKGIPSIDLVDNILQHGGYAGDHSRNAAMRFSTRHSKVSHVLRFFDGGLEVLEAEPVGTIGVSARIVHQDCRDRDIVQEGHEIVFGVVMLR